MMMLKRLGNVLYDQHGHEVQRKKQNYINDQGLENEAASLFAMLKEHFSATYTYTT